MAAKHKLKTHGSQYQAQRPKEKVRDDPIVESRMMQHLINVKLKKVIDEEVSCQGIDEINVDQVLLSVL